MTAPRGAPETSPATGAGRRTELVELQDTLYNSRNPTRRWLHRDRLARISAELRGAAGELEGGRALEVGPGAGPYVGLLCDLFADVVATDIEAEYLDHVRAVHGERENLTLVADDIAESGLEPQSFDLVLCTEMIEHAPHPARVLRGIHRLLRPGGVLVLSTPQAFSTVELLGRVAFWPGIIQVVRAIYREPILPTGHISLLTRRRVRLLLTETGLTPESAGVGGLYLPLVAEAGGTRALAIERALAGRLARGPLAWLLWTQYWTCRKPG